MATATGKRKREAGVTPPVQVKKIATGPRTSHGKSDSTHKTQPALDGSHAPGLTNDGVHTAPPRHMSVQIVTGSYERVLHGISATITIDSIQASVDSTTESELHEAVPPPDAVTFADTFLFAAHTSSIRCLALSPSSETGKRILATGGSDERINLYQLASSVPPGGAKQSVTLAVESTPAATDSRNKPLGNLIHHERAVSRLHFPTKSKLFSAAEDNTVAISRTRDWTVLSSIKAPVPKAYGRPSGDTAGPGEVPAGINDFAIHPSQKLMLTISRGEKCMRLWNLMTGKKAGVLNFDRDLLIQVGEGKHSSGEGRRVLWDDEGESFIIAFERGAVVFGIDSKPKGVIRPDLPTKFHQMQFVPSVKTMTRKNVVAISTEDGRILFFHTNLPAGQADAGKLPQCTCIAELGGLSASVAGRIKDFEMLPLPSSLGDETFLAVTGNSDGAVRIWNVAVKELDASASGLPNGDRGTALDNSSESRRAPTIGKMIGLLETTNRITCLGAFVMDDKVPEGVEDEEPVMGNGLDESSGESEGDE